MLNKNKKDMKMLKQVKEEAITRINNIKGIYSDRYHWFNDNWYSTCKPDPLAGGISKHLKAPVKVEFVDKYKRKHTGYLYYVSYEKVFKTFCGIVLVYGVFGPNDNEFTNCSLSLNKMKFLEPFDAKEAISDFPENIF